MIKYPDWHSFQEKVRQAMLNNDEDAMGRAMEEYAKEIRGSGQILDMYKEEKIREAKEYLHEMFKELDVHRDQGSSS